MVRFARLRSIQPPRMCALLSRHMSSCKRTGNAEPSLVTQKIAWACGSAALAFAWLKPASCQESGTTVLRVDGMGCQGCVGRVRGALEAVNDVENARVDLQAKLAWVQGAPRTDDLVAAVKATGKEASVVGLAGSDGFVKMTATELKTSLAKSGRRGLVLDIDETLSATNVAWFERLEQLFGNPTGLPLEQLIQNYHLAQNVPFWQSEEALAWMQSQRDDPRAQDGLPLIPGAVEGVHSLANVTNVVGYCTVRPETVSANTIAWLRENGFPDLPVVSKPSSVPFAEGNNWKANALKEMWPEVTGIVDDNPKLPIFATKSYPGKIYLFGHASCPAGAEHAMSCATWPAVVDRARSV
eukprot:TRINITY_DN22892_c0_g1_i1.p1 TRINITY_DN22892_c0_g1~~TRINITY_DN22892_c0_g1_i1.p1  ORF type:complete len:355 (+),score=54.11 TRINITY_DN22892_c0_g1_i1:103-1167(+)